MNRQLKRILWISGLAGGGALALVLFCFDPARVPIYPLCTFHRLTGLDCPGCGSLRALHALLHGQVWTALQFNALTVLSVPVLAWLAFRIIRHKADKGPALNVRPLWLWLYLAAWIGFGILRDLPAPLFAWLAP